MKTRVLVWQTLVLCLALLIGTQVTAQDLPKTFSVARCFDGDTVKLTDRRIVRLAGIDTPELAHEKTYEQFYAKKAQKELESLVTGSQSQSWRSQCGKQRPLWPTDLRSYP